MKKVKEARTIAQELLDKKPKSDTGLTGLGLLVGQYR